MKAFISFSLTFACVTMYAQSVSMNGNAKPAPMRLVVVGDSLSAGVQNFSLLDTQQPHGFANVIAEQAGWPLTLPLVPFPGAPNVLQYYAGPPVQILPAPGALPAFRDNPGVQPTNIAVPGLTVPTALTLRPSLQPASAEQAWATIVLGFPGLLAMPPKAPTEIELADVLLTKSSKPKMVIEWLGNNDALVPALVGQISALTPVTQFAVDYEQILDRLQATGTPIVTATVPDVTEVPYFTSALTIANETGLTLSAVTSKLQIGPNDYLRPTAVPLAVAILSNPNNPGPLPSACPAPLPDLGASTLPCVLTDADAKTVRATVNCYNLIIQFETIAHGGVVVDVHGLVDQIYTSGYQLPDGEVLTADFFGGLFSLDGIHPTNTGYGVIANEFIRIMNANMGTKIPAADISAIFAADPLAQYAMPHFMARQSPNGSSEFCLDLR